MRYASFLIALVALLAASATAAASESFRGRLEIRHTDDMAHGKSSTRYTLHRSKQRRLRVRPAKPPTVASGSRVVIRGRKRGRVVAGDVRPAPGVRPAAAGVLGDYRVAVMLVNFTDDRRQPWTPADVSSRFFTATDSLDVYFKEQSYDQLNLEGDVYGWYELASEGAGCDVDAWAAAARSRATAEGVALSAYDSIAYVFPRQADCGFGGLAELPGDDLWLNGTISQRVSAHELGHNMGVHHAAALSCTRDGAGAAISSSCSMLEYGDPFSSMGNSSRRMASWHLQQLGYLQPANVQSVTADGTYSVRTTLSQSLSDPQVLKIPRSTAGEYYYVDLRAPGGVFDAFTLTDPAVNGVTIRVGHEPATRLQSKLIDTTPDSYSNTSQDFLDAPLAAGRTFTDGEVSITATAIEGGVATVEVSWSAEPPDSEAPTRPVITEASHHGSYVDVKWDASGDNVGVTGYRVRRDGATVATVTGTSYRDTNVRQSASYRYCVEAFDAAGNVARSTSCWDSGYYVPPPVEPPPPTDDGDGTDDEDGDDYAKPPADTRKPVVRILSPGRGTKLRRGRRATIRAKARDDEGVETMELYVDGMPVAARRGAKLKLRWSLKRVRPGRHVVTVLARDAAGNTGRRSVSMRVR